MGQIDPDWSKARAAEAERVLARVRKVGGGQRLQQVHFYPELVKLRVAGWSTTDMAKYLGAAGGPTTARAYQLIIQKQSKIVLPRTSREELPPDLQAMCQWEAESFIEFYERYSPWTHFPKHQRSWVEAFIRERNLLLNVPPGHAKSTLFMTWIPIWLICRDRNVQILLVSNNETDAATWAREIAAQLEEHPQLIHDFGRFAPETIGDQRWNISRGVFSVSGRTRTASGAQYTVESRGMTGGVLGRRADFIIVDDPTKQEDADSETTRKSQMRHLQQQVFTRAEPQGEDFPHAGRICVVGQRVHINDCYGTLERQEWEVGQRRGERVWHNEKYPAVLDWDKKVTLWPERFPWDEIELAYARVGGHVPFETMYQQNPMPEGASLVTREWIERCKDYGRGAGQGFRLGDPSIPIVRVVAVDPSPTKFNGIMVGDLAYHPEQFAFAMTEARRLPAGVREMQGVIDHLLETTNPDYLIFESSAVTAWLRDDPWFMELKDRVKLIDHKTGVNKNSAEFGVQSLAGDFEFARISLPWGDEEGRRMTDLLTNEALVYPQGETNDLLMALWFIKFNYQSLRPPRSKPGRVDTNRRRLPNSYGFMAKLKGRKNAEDENYRRWQERKREKEMERVG